MPASIKKKRVNYRLRKLIAPKSPVQILNEIVGAVHYDFVDNPPMPEHMLEQMNYRLYTAQCTVGGEYFAGTGPSKAIAKNICAEHAIQHVVSKKSVSSAVARQQPDAPKVHNLQCNYFQSINPTLFLE